MSKFFARKNDNRTKNTLRNISTGLVTKILNIILPFIIRTLIIKLLGAEYAGLSSLFTSILQVLSVAELGFASAITFSMYKPIADGDTEEINRLLTLYRSIYWIVGTVILVAGLVICPFIGYMINGSYPADINIYILYCIYLANTGVSYFFYGYKSVVLTAYQRRDYLNNIETCVLIIRSIVQIVVLIFSRNFYLYIIFLPIFTLLSNIIMNVISVKVYPEIKCDKFFSLKGIRGISKQIGGVALGKISVIARNGFDSIILTSLFGLVVSSIYSNYYYIFSAVFSVLAVLLQSMSASIGNSLATESIEKNYEDHLKYDFFYQLIASFCTICLFCLYQPFMKIWVGEELMFSDVTVILFCIYFYTTNLAQIRSAYSESAGLWWHFRYLTIAEMLGNIILNFVLGYYIGVDGVILATIVTSFLSSFIGITIVVFRRLFKVSPLRYYLYNFIYLLITLIGCILINLLCSVIKMEGIYGFIIQFIVCGVVSMLYMLICYLMIKPMREYLRWAINVVKTKIMKT